MNVRYSDLRVAVSSDGRHIDVALTVHNEGREVWSGAEGDCLSYQIFDASGHSLLLDGPRSPYPAAVPPRSRISLTLSVELPAEPGHYRVYLSPLRESASWFYELGLPFVLLEAEVRDGKILLGRGAVTTVTRQRLLGLLRTAGRAFVYPIRTMIRHRSLIRSMVRRDIVGRYRGSYGGLFWTVFHPLLLMVTYWFVFGIVLRARFTDDPRPSSFVLYFLAGMLPWLAFSEAAGRAPTTIVEHSNFVKKLVFPVETLPVNLVMAGLFSQVFGVGIFLLAMTVFGRALPPTVLYLPLILIPQFLLTLGVCWFLAALGVFFRDLGQVNGFLLTVWFFLTPICYPEASLPQNYLWLFEKNPMYVLVQSYRLIFLEASAPPWRSLGVLTAFSGLVFVLGHGWYYKLKGSFADLV